MTQYAKGYAFEQKVAGHLTQDGYFCIRAGGSHGVADVVALKAGQALLVQCKTDGVISIADWNALLRAANMAGAVALLALRPKRGVIEYRQLMGPAWARHPRPYEVWTADEVVADV